VFTDAWSISARESQLKRLIAEAATRPIDELAEENERPQHRLEVIIGGAA